MATKTKQSVVYADRRIIPIIFFAVSDTFMFVSISVVFFTLSRFPLGLHGLIPCCEVFAYVPLGFFPGLYCFLVGVKSAKMKNLLIHSNVCLKFVARFVEKNSSMPAGIPAIIRIY